jgi:NAD+ diphosphatase
MEHSLRNTFSGLRLDRMSGLRENDSALDDLFDRNQNMQFLIAADGSVLCQIEPGSGLRFERFDTQAPRGEEVLFLGHTDATNYLAVRVRVDEKATVEAATGANFIDLRKAAGHLVGFEAGLSAYARGLTLWHARNQFCAVCGAATAIRAGGHKRVCAQAACKSEHFPRTDPAIICLVTHQGKALLGRQSSWPIGRYSTLAGFVEPGESLEDAVRREVDEEAGVVLSGVHYFASQPWPFPASIMLGFVAEAASDRIQVGEELEHARWFDVNEFRAGIIDGSLRASPPLSISYRLIEHWYDQHANDTLEALWQSHTWSF